MSTQTNDIKTILVIGNGFDKKCGLKSSYNDFLNDKNFWPTDSSKYHSIEKSFWYAIFTYVQLGSQAEYWWDLENRILKIITNYNLIRQNPDLIPISRSRSYKNIDSIELLKELKKFEIDFQKYLLLQIEACGKTTDSTAFRYSDNVKKLINKIDQKIEANSHFYILNFNYTQILTFLKPLYALENNVHGTLNSEIIMGIDDANVKGELFYFSKTYKKLLSHLPMYTIPDEIKQIAFFGHSLSDADYSYFHSLFDYYNLYGSKVVLKFCYSPGYLNITSIYKLIHKYGETFSNKQQGKNLLHKLLLENRIQIIEIA